MSINKSIKDSSRMTVGMDISHKEPKPLIIDAEGEAPAEPAAKRAPGRPRKFKKNEETVVLGIRVKKEEAEFLERHGGAFGGKTGYVTLLIQEEMRNFYRRQAEQEEKN